MFGVDYAWGRPSITSLKAAGVTFACRYLSHDTSGKNLDPAEAARLSNAGIWIVVVWESTATRSLAGHAAGVADAQDAAAQARACGMPNDRPVYFAVDFDATGSQQPAINAYLDGAASVLGKNRVGIYGGYNPVRRALDGGHCKWAWQTYAWSGGAWDGRAQIEQYSNDHVIGGVGLDYDRSTNTDFGHWKVGVSPATKPTPPPVPTEDDDMPTGDLVAGTDPATCLTVRALARSKYNTIGFNCDNGLQGLLPATLRVALHATDDHGVGSWHVSKNVVVDSKAGQKVLALPTDCDGFSILHEDAKAVTAAGGDPTKVDTAGAVTVGWEVS